MKNHFFREGLLLQGAESSGVLVRDKRLRSSVFVRKYTASSNEGCQPITSSLPGFVSSYMCHALNVSETFPQGRAEMGRCERGDGWGPLELKALTGFSHF